MTTIHPVALFRLSVLGPLLNRDQLTQGELKRILRELAEKPYAIPGSQRCYLSEKTIEAWYYRYRHQSIEGLTPKVRSDRGRSKLSPPLQEAILQAKRDNPKRSLDEIRRLLETEGLAARGVLSRSSLHRLLQQHGLSSFRGLIQRKNCAALKHNMRGTSGTAMSCMAPGSSSRVGCARPTWCR
jgi:putative transposase